MWIGIATDMSIAAGEVATVRLAAGGVAEFDIVVADAVPQVVPPAAAKPIEIEFGNPRTSVWETAHLLAEYLRASTGATFVVRKESTQATRPGALHLGATQFAKARLADESRAGNLDPDGFIHDIIDTKNIVIFGGSDLGTEYGVYDFLERHVGVRWLFPGEIGEHVPSHATLDVPAGFFRDEPKFLTRCYRPHRVEGAILWASRNRANLRVEFHHNIPKLFPHKLIREHPELYPIIDGERYLPPRINMDTWHPCYTAPGAVDVTVGLINDFFRRYPEYSSVSLGVSDANEGRNCHCEACVARYPGTLNTLGFEERSNIYYDWCNKVIAGVLAKYPDKKFGTLAYRGVTDPPQGFAVHDRLVPYICFDRMLWADATRAAQDRKMTEGWAQAASELGWYDYLFGETYVVPRIYSHTLQQALQFAYANKVRHYYGEDSPSKDWHEGPKVYIALRLLWNPDADVDALLADWCEAAVGPRAAPALVRYFNHLETFWTKRVPRTAWFGDRSKIYLIFNTLGYLDALTKEDVDKCMQWLKQAEALAGDARQKQRATQLREGFEKRRRDSIDYFMLNNQIPTDPRRLRDVKVAQTLDFNSQPSGWEPYSSENRGTWHWESGAGRNGSGALRLDNATAIIRRGTTVNPTGTYRISGWYKVEGALPDSSRLEMKIEWRDQNREEFRRQMPSKLLPVDKAGQWQQFSLLCLTAQEPGREGHSLGIGLLLHNAPESSVLFDDITVTEIATRP